MILQWASESLPLMLECSALRTHGGCKSINDVPALVFLGHNEAHGDFSGLPVQLQ
jgi:hypothetical protein